MHTALASQRCEPLTLASFVESLERFKGLLAWEGTKHSAPDGPVAGVPSSRLRDLTRVLVARLIDSESVQMEVTQHPHLLASLACLSERRASMVRMVLLLVKLGGRQMGGGGGDGDQWRQIRCVTYGGGGDKYGV